MTEKGWFTQASDAAAERQQAARVLIEAAKETLDYAVGHSKNCHGAIRTLTGEFVRCDCYRARLLAAMARVEELLP